MKTRELAVAYVIAVLCCNAIAMEQSQPRYNANRLIGNRNRFLNYKLAVHDVPKALSVMRGGSVYDLEVMKGARDITGDGGVRKMIVSEVRVAAAHVAPSSSGGCQGVHNEMPVNGDELFVYFNGSLACFDNGTTIVQGKNISGTELDLDTLNLLHAAVVVAILHVRSCPVSAPAHLPAQDSSSTRAWLENPCSTLARLCWGPETPSRLTEFPLRILEKG